MMHASRTAPLLLALGIPIALGLGLTSPSLLAAQAPMQAPTPQDRATPPGPLDTSGVALFWATADRLAAGDSLTDADWDAFFAHPGYAVTETSGQRASVIRHCMPAAFHPAGDLEHARANPPEGEGRQALVERLCDHMASIRAQRPELEAYVASLEGLDLLAEARRAASRYLPDGVVDHVPTPAAYVLLFEAQGFGRDGVIVLDGFMMMTQPRAQTVEFMAHELHHAYRDSFAELDPAPAAAPLVYALDGIVNEGSASMLDKAGYVRTGRTPEGFPPVFLELAAAAPERLAAIDRVLADLTPTPEGYEAAAREVRSQSPWGGHLNGTYMGMAIEDAFGRAAVVEAQVSPVRFFRSYQRAAASLGGDYFRFSDAAMAVILALPETR
jgi:hypothetical protein